ncbi:hypothetical protein PTSG_06155 [Salpingoeca rosetta]|uniref:Cytochrome P450 n=1 Tax=Salpingoeca rosetta (strain ATCC 50818 / BSB-021) TaxID=946362 RepID=F2UC39_SALR5|nr:uncharacterized protein PTSG_06155 [Salpingoeca rosetta]EGD74146.1 hypothetical protein PTSG_06155 [Salpingoeca rosetta]|eukprot:XP_004993047.1 hypothetical protein PTSG_06155 [Salpingoeca rosetta]
MMRTVMMMMMMMMVLMVLVVAGGLCGVVEAVGGEMATGHDGVMALLAACGLTAAVAAAAVLWHNVHSLGIQVAPADDGTADATDDGTNKQATASHSVHIERGIIPWIGCGLSFIKNPTKYLEDMRAQHGDTFVVLMFGVRFLFTFSPEGLQSLYGFRERDASFTEATKGLLGLKLPQEILSENDLRKFHHGLKPKLMSKYVTYANVAVQQRLRELGAEGRFELFQYLKKVVHTIGMTCWVGPKALEPPYFERLIRAYEALDPEDGFQDLSRLFSTLALRRTREKRALNDMEAVLKAIWLDQDAEGEEPVVAETDIEDNLANLHDLHRDLPDKQRYRQVAIDVFHFQLASQANMYAGMAWTLVRLLKEDNAILDRVLHEFETVKDKHGDDFIMQGRCLDELVYLEAVVMETLRMAQQSITLRKTLKPVDMKTERGTVHIETGWYVGTLLSVTNTNTASLPPTPGAAPLDTFDPNRFLSDDGKKVHLRVPEGTPRGMLMSVSAFGHGIHACPGRRFALNMTKICLYHILSRFTLSAEFPMPVPPPSSVGALARVTTPCYVSYTAK